TSAAARDRSKTRSGAKRRPRSCSHRTTTRARRDPRPVSRTRAVESVPLPSHEPAERDQTYHDDDDSEQEAPGDRDDDPDDHEDAAEADPASAPTASECHHKLLSGRFDSTVNAWAACSKHARGGDVRPKPIMPRPGSRWSMTMSITGLVPVSSTRCRSTPTGAPASPSAGTR